MELGAIIGASEEEVVVILTRRAFLRSLGGGALALPLALGLPLPRPRLARAQAQGQGQGQAELPTLRVSLPPVIESFPIAFAQDQGVFAEEGLNVELVGLANRRARNLALFTGEVDGALTDVTSVLTLLASQGEVKITSTAFDRVEGFRRYGLWTHHFAYISDLETLLQRLDGQNNRVIGLLRQTDMEYELDRLLLSHNFTPDEAKHYADFEDLVLLATLLGQGSILAALLPEPIGSYMQYITEAEGTPVVLLSDFNEQALVPSVLAFQTALVEAGDERLDAFYRGYRRVLERLQAMPRERIIEVGLEAALTFFFPGVTREELPPGAEAFMQEYLIPEFPPPRALTPEEFDGVAEWARAKGYIEQPVPFEVATTDRYAS